MFGSLILLASVHAAAAHIRAHAFISFIYTTFTSLSPIIPSSQVLLSKGVPDTTIVNGTIYLLTVSRVNMPPNEFREIRASPRSNPIQSIQSTCSTVYRPIGEMKQPCETTDSTYLGASVLHPPPVPYPLSLSGSQIQHRPQGRLD